MTLKFPLLHSSLTFLSVITSFSNSSTAFGFVSHNSHPSVFSRSNKISTIEMTSSTSAAESSIDVSNSFTRIPSLSSLPLDDYDTILLDMWGVMHDGTMPYEGVLEAVKKLKETGKTLIVLSNSSKKKENSVKMLTKLGFDPLDFEQIITSGDVSHSLLQNKADELGCSNWSLLSEIETPSQKKVFVFGSGDQDEEYCTSAGWELSSIEDADLIVARGTFTINDGSGKVVSKKENEMEYWRVMEESLIAAAKRKIPMLVTNPDKVRPDAGLPPMPGAIGDAYERYLWTTHCHPIGDMTETSSRDYVKRIGKPFSEVYDIALRGRDASRAVMIGDALETDVTGGMVNGVDSVWVVRDGIHREDVEKHEKGEMGVVEEFCGRSEYTYAYGEKVMPKFVVDHFRW